MPYWKMQGKRKNMSVALDFYCRGVDSPALKHTSIDLSPVAFQETCYHLSKACRLLYLKRYGFNQRFLKLQHVLETFKTEISGPNSQNFWFRGCPLTHKNLNFCEASWWCCFRSWGPHFENYLIFFNLILLPWKVNPIVNRESDIRLLYIFISEL